MGPSFSRELVSLLVQGEERSLHVAAGSHLWHSTNFTNDLPFLISIMLIYNPLISPMKTHF